MPDRPERFQLAKPKRNRAPKAKTAARGYGSKWQVAARAYLRRHPLCRQHEANGEIVAATVVDHIVPHRGNKALFWASGNWQPLCSSCHNRKSGRE